MDGTENRGASLARGTASCVFGRRLWRYDAEVRDGLGYHLNIIEALLKSRAIESGGKGDFRIVGKKGLAGGILLSLSGVNGMSTASKALTR